MALDKTVLAKHRKLTTAQPPLAALCGSEKQIKWATTIREKAMKHGWFPEIKAKLAAITDATWWIANQNIVDTMKFKEPSPAQMGPMSTPVGPGADLFTKSEPAAAPTVIPPRSAAAERIHDAALWAESVSKHPKLAEAAILSVLKKLYESKNNAVMTAAMKERAEKALAESDHVITKDLDAIKRMLE